VITISDEFDELCSAGEKLAALEDAEGLILVPKSHGIFFIA